VIASEARVEDVRRRHGSAGSPSDALRGSRPRRRGNDEQGSHGSGGDVYRHVPSSARIYSPLCAALSAGGAVVAGGP